MIVCLLKNPSDQALSLALGTLRGETVRFNSIDPAHELIFVDEHSFSVVQNHAFREVVVIGSETFIEEQLPTKLFSNFVIRKPVAVDPVQWAENFIWAKDFEQKLFWPHKKQPSLYHLERTAEKPELLRQVFDLCNHWKLPTRVTNLAVTAADELLLNAFFDAPVDRERVPLNKKINRALPLTSPEPITFALEVVNNYLVFSVVDNFGSLNLTSLINHLSRGYKRHYQPSAQSSGAGIGLSTMQQRGVNFIFKTHSQHFTQASAFIKITENYKNFQENSVFFITQIKNS